MFLIFKFNIKLLSNINPTLYQINMNDKSLNLLNYKGYVRREIKFAIT